MLHSQKSILERYTVSLKHGFLPATVPLQRLEDPYYSSWEKIAGSLPRYIQIGRIRHAVESLPILSTTNLRCEQEWRRAYVVLAYLAHAYIWGGERPNEILPPCISRPFLEVSAHLELPPCATYAAVCLWNFSVKPGTTGLADPDNLVVNTSFTGTKDEEWFFMVSIAIEEIGAKLLPHMLDVFDAVAANNSRRVASLVIKIASGIDDIANVLGRMNEKCAPTIFFHQIRPFLAGSKNMAAAGLPNGVFYNRGNGVGEWHQHCGGSNAQSSLIQAFDIFLGVQHSATGESGPHSSAKGGYLHSMRKYMPGPHHRFLDLLTRLSNLRPYAMSQTPDSAVRIAYNAAVQALTSLRDKHMQLVARYILLASKVQPVSNLSGRVNLATATSKIKESGPVEESKEYHGTGGTELMPFLKQTRDATRAAGDVSMN